MMQPIKTMTDTQVYNMVGDLFDQACTELNLPQSGTIPMKRYDPISGIPVYKIFKYDVNLTAYDSLRKYLQTKYNDRPSDIFSDKFIKNHACTLAGDFYFTDQNKLVYEIDCIFDRIGIMYSHRPNISDEKFKRFILLKIKKDLGYLLYYFDKLKCANDPMSAFEECIKWFDEAIGFAHKYLDQFEVGMGTREYYNCLMAYNMAIEPIFKLAGVDVGEITVLEMEVRDNLFRDNSILPAYLNPNKSYYDGGTNNG